MDLGLVKWMILLSSIFLFAKQCKAHHDACSNYLELDDYERSASFHRGRTRKCDGRDLRTPRWYRFTGRAGTQMPTTCVKRHHCGTHAPGWLSSSHPTRLGEVVAGTVCFHWYRSCCHWKANIKIKLCNGFYVYELVKPPVCWLRYCGINRQVFDECKHYEELKDQNRAASVHRGNFLRCDRNDMPVSRWYRFIGSAGDKMPTSCVPTHYCGTHAPGWLSTPHPTAVGQVVNGKVCFHWRNSCCYWHAPIKVKNCSGFYIYELGKTPVCWLRYCGNAGFVFDECKHYEELKDQNRAASVHRGNFLRCDRNDMPVSKWYRFTGSAGDKMPSSCVPTHYCGTHAPGWLSTPHPTAVGQVVNGKVCFHWRNSCCYWHAPIKVKNCSGFYIYELGKTPVCWLRYCGNAGFDPCKANKPCKNGATCRTENDEYTCLCKPGYEGKNCEMDVDECLTRPCQNGGTCENLQGSYRCKCKNGFLGEHCEIDPCRASKPCKNGATCKMQDIGYTCLCKPGYEGRNCESDVDECLTRPCQNGGTCENLQGSYRCKCKKGFLGKHCETDVDECLSRPCQNNGTCKNFHGSYRCICKEGFLGKDCETVFEECVHCDELSDRDRAAGDPRGNVLKCDQHDLPIPKWYRFTGSAGTRMPTSCVPTDHCGTNSPGWLSSPHPSSVGEMLDAKVCFHWSRNCCYWSANIQVKKCSGFFVYRFVRPPYCSLRYCGNANFDDCKVNNPCRNGATCKTGPNGFTCLCKAGYDGRNCEIVLDACTRYDKLKEKDRAAGRPRLGNSDKCDQQNLPTPKWYRFTGEAGSEMPVSCAPENHCGTHAAGWLKGNHPTKEGEIVDGEVCFHWAGDCCRWSVIIQVKKCKGYFVYKLKRTPACSLRYCGNWGFDECIVNTPCRNGATCVPGNGSYTCNCKPGFKGKQCDQDVDECLTSPCADTGTCENVHGGYNCRCEAGFTGRHCENDIDECHADPCGNEGTCSNNQGSYKCDCKSGFTGRDCENDVDECSSSPCNNGTCNNAPGSYKCDCAPGFTGDFCDQDVDECSSNPCKNNGKCNNTLGSYKCHCASGFTGNLCDQDVNECTSSPCKNNGKCTNAPGSYTCDCPQEFKGEFCEHDVDECASTVCQNSGICNNTFGNYSCQCLKGFEGDNCEKDKDECTTEKPCKNNGNCKNEVGSYTCQCPFGYDGKHCENKKDYVGLGCYKDKRQNRAMKKMMANIRKFIIWKDISQTIHNCSEIARNHSFPLFAIQYYGECWGAPGNADYAKHGPGDDCWSGVGGANNNYVYELS